MEERFSRKELLAAFERIDASLDRPQSICLIGAAAILCHGSPERQTQDVDVWAPASNVAAPALRAASAKAGLDYDPMGDDVTGPYIQMVRPGVVQLPEYADGKWATGRPSDVLWEGANLKVSAPPAAILVAAKLVRAEPRDIDDSVYLIATRGVSEVQVRQAIGKIPDPAAREAARENMVYLQIVLGDGMGPQRAAAKAWNAREERGR